MVKLIFLIAFTGSSCLMYSQSSICRSQPVIQNYPTTEYKSANQNWSISQDKSGILYFANTSGLLEFNGAEWKLNVHPDLPTIRSVYVDIDQRIYCGSYEEFGYWTRDAGGILNYKSLSKALLGQKDLSNITIWKIERIGKYLYFHSFSKIFIYDGSKFIIISSRNPILPFFKYKGRPFMQILDSGLFYIDDQLSLSKEKMPGCLTDARIRYISEISSDTSIIFTENNGIFISAGSFCKQLKLKGLEDLKNFQINRVIELENKIYVVGTINHGVFITDAYGNLKFHLDKTNGLQHNTVLALHGDLLNNIWIGLEKGIDFAEINSPVSIINDKSGHLGSVRCTALWEGKLFIGTNQGLFHTSWDDLVNNRNVEFTAVPGLYGSINSLNVMDQKLICGFNTGTYEIGRNGIKKLSSVGGGNLLVHPLNPNLAYQGIYTGIALYKHDPDGNWVYSKMLSGGNNIRFIQFDHDGNLWASSSIKGLSMHQLSNEGDSIINTINFGAGDGFLTDYFINVFKLGNTVVFTNGGTFFTYDYINKKIVPFHWLNRQLGAYSEAQYLFSPDPAEYWFLTKNAIGKFRYLLDTLEMRYEIKYNNLHSSAIESWENISKINNQYYSIGLNEGFAILNNAVKPSPSILSVYKLLISRVEFFDNKGNILTGSNATLANPRVSYDKRNIRICFSVPASSQEIFTFYYRLKDQDSWTLIEKSNILQYNNLSFGYYNLKIRVTEVGSGAEQSAEYPFVILPPWYLRWYTIILYSLFLVSVLFAIRKAGKIYMRRQKLILLRNTRRSNEVRLARITEEALKTEVRRQDNALSNYSILLEKRNEILEQIKEIVVNEANGPNVNLKNKLVKFIERNLKSKNDWHVLKSTFDNSHSEYLKKLKSQHPNLTPSDLRFCAFLRMNMTSKEICSISSISLRSIEVKRYRLRKKLNLEHDKNLIDYLMHI